MLVQRELNTLPGIRRLPPAIQNPGASSEPRYQQQAPPACQARSTPVRSSTSSWSRMGPEGEMRYCQLPHQEALMIIHLEALAMLLDVTRHIPGWAQP